MSLKVEAVAMSFFQKQHPSFETLKRDDHRGVPTRTELVKPEYGHLQDSREIQRTLKVETFAPFCCPGPDVSKRGGTSLAHDLLFSRIPLIDDAPPIEWPSTFHHSSPARRPSAGPWPPASAKGRRSARGRRFAIDVRFPRLAISRSARSLRVAFRASTSCGDPHAGARSSRDTQGAS